MITIVPTYLFNMEKMNFCGALCTFLSIFERKTQPVSKELICNETILQKYSLYTIMNCGRSTSLYNVYIWMLFGIIFGTEKEAFLTLPHYSKMPK